MNFLLILLKMKSLGSLFKFLITDELPFYFCTIYSKIKLCKIKLFLKYFDPIDPT